MGVELLWNLSAHRTTGGGGGICLCVCACGMCMWGVLYVCMCGISVWYLYCVCMCLRCEGEEGKGERGKRETDRDPKELFPTFVTIMT